MPHYIPAAPGTLALLAYSHDDINDGYTGIGIIETIVFAFKTTEDSFFYQIEPVTQCEFDAGKDEISAIEFADGKVLHENEIYETREHFIHYCESHFEWERKNKAQKAEKALKELLG